MYVYGCECTGYGKYTQLVGRHTHSYLLHELCVLARLLLPLLLNRQLLLQLEVSDLSLVPE